MKKNRRQKKNANSQYCTFRRLAAGSTQQAPQRSNTPVLLQCPALRIYAFYTAMLQLHHATPLTANTSTDHRESVDQSIGPSSACTTHDLVTHTRVMQQHQWKQLLIQSHREPKHVDPVIIKPVPEPQLILRTSGVTRINLNTNGIRRLYIGQPGDLFLTAPKQDPYELQWTSLIDQPVETLHLYLSSRLLGQTAAELLGVDASRIALQDGSCLVDPLLQQLAFSLGQELNHPSAGGDLYTQTAAQLMAIQLLRQHCILRYAVPERGGKLAPARLREVKDYIMAHLDQAISLDSLAAVACMSVYHFCRVFKRTTGLSPYQYVIERRLARAQQLLKINHPVTQVALAVGYESARHFAQLFQRRFGCSPSQFKSITA